jgi:hypothetical protein
VLSGDKLVVRILPYALLLDPHGRRATARRPLFDRRGAADPVPDQKRYLRPIITAWV